MPKATYGSGATKRSHYKPLTGEALEKVRAAKRRAAIEKPAPLPPSNLPATPLVVKTDPEKALSLRLSDDAPRRDRNW